MDETDKINFIREKCIDANPRRQKGWDVDSGRPTGSGYLDKMPCRLADVLLAIAATRERNPKKWYAISTSGIFLENKVEEITATPFAHPMVSALYSWTLRADDLTQQSDETINSLYDLLQ